MKELIIKALNEAIHLLERQVPYTKSGLKYINIEDISPLDLNRFMIDNNIPSDASFDVDGDSEQFFVTSYPCLKWCIEVPTTEEDRLAFKVKRFDSTAFRCVYDILISEGYKRKGFNSGLLKDFKDTTIYDLFINGEYDRLVGYYSIHFKLD